MGKKEVTRKADIDDFIAQKTLALVGVSRKKMKFGDSLYKELKKRGYRVFPVNAYMDTYEGDPCYKDLKTLPEPVGGALITVRPDKTGQLVKDAAAAGIKRVWIQQGSKSDAAIATCKENNITYVSNECLLMFLEPVASFHKFHRWIRKLFGNLPVS